MSPVTLQKIQWTTNTKTRSAFWCFKIKYESSSEEAISGREKNTSTLIIIHTERKDDTEYVNKTLIHGEIEED